MNDFYVKQLIVGA